MCTHGVFILSVNASCPQSPVSEQAGRQCRQTVHTDTADCVYRLSEHTLGGCRESLFVVALSSSLSWVGSRTSYHCRLRDTECKANVHFYWEMSRYSFAACPLLAASLSSALLSAAFFAYLLEQEVWLSASLSQTVSSFASFLSCLSAECVCLPRAATECLALTHHEALSIACWH